MVENIKIYNKIGFWIILFFLIRLIEITNPPLETSHNWRQVTGLMVARNFLEVDANILYPRVDDNNGKTGIIGMEFPSMNYIYFSISKIFGYKHWYGRIINLLISSIGIFYFYKLICLTRFGKRIAFISSLLLLSSIWFSFSRKMMPDTYCISLVFIGLYYGIKYLEENKTVQLILYIFFGSLAVLSKIPAGIYFAILIPLLISRKYKLKPKIVIAVTTLVPILSTYFWYFMWNPKLANEFGNWYNSGKDLSTGFYEIIGNMDKVLDNFYFDAFSGFIFFSLFIIGIVLMFIKKEFKIIIAFFSIFIPFLIYIFKSGSIFYHHNYYIIPFVPIMAFLAAYTISLMPKKWLYIVLIAGTFESLANQQHDLFIKETNKYKASLEAIMDKVSNKDDLILINGNENPQMIYFSHRKGWSCSNNQLLDSSFVKSVINKRCKYIVIDKHSSENINLPFDIVFENDDFLIHSADKKTM